MKVYYAVHDFGNGSGDECRSMEDCISYFVNSLFGPTSQEITNLRTNDTINLRPGECCFFVGGKASLERAFADKGSVSITTTDNRCLTVEMRTGLRATRNLKRAFAGVKGLLLARKNQDDEDRILNEYTRKELTLVAVYHSDKSQKSNALSAADVHKHECAQHATTLTLAQLKQLFINKLFVQAVAKEF